MKKLMIAVAAAAMIGGAFAEGYDFTATLKTTKGKMGKDSTQTYNLGRNSAGRMWYTAQRADQGNHYVTNILAKAGVLTKKTVDGNTVPAVLKTDKGYIAFPDGASDDQKNAAISDIIWAAANYDEKSDGKWCETVKILTDAFCYRVAGSQKIKTQLWQYGCCHEENMADMDFWGSHGEEIAYPTNGSFVAFQNNYLLNRFGGDTARKCNKVEIFARALFPQENDFQGYLAGQGSFKYDGEGPSAGYVTSISGNIVGTVAAPKCESCCLEELPIAEAWTCPDLYFTTYRSAAFGSFRLKYNKNY